MVQVYSKAKENMEKINVVKCPKDTFQQMKLINT